MQLKQLSMIALLVCTGCTDPKQASEANFKQAIQAYLDTTYPRCYVESNFPTETQEFDIRGTNRMLHALAKVDVVKETELSRKEIPASFGMEARTDIRYAYDLTEEGRKYFKPEVVELMSGKKLGGLCFGRAHLLSVDNFTEPADMMGQKISHVTYSWSVTDLPDWASRKEVVEMDRALEGDVDSGKNPHKETKVVVLTNKGWVHERLFGR
ncbi:hypothetical protein D9M69_483810 [compost metagenome]